MVWYSHLFENFPQFIFINTVKVNTGKVLGVVNEEEVDVFLELNPKKDVLYIIGDWNAKVGSQEIPGVTLKFGLGVQNEAHQRLTKSVSKRTHWS